MLCQVVLFTLTQEKLQKVQGGEGSVALPDACRHSRGNTPGFVRSGGKPAQEIALWTKNHTDSLVLYTQTGELWFNCSVETSVSSNGAYSQRFKIKCWPLLLNLLQNRKYLDYLKVKCLLFLTAVNVFS